MLFFSCFQIHKVLGAPQDECSCIGCKQCVWIAQGTFRIEPAHGRSRVFAQWVDTEDDIQVRGEGGVDPAVLRDHTVAVPY